MLSRSLAIGLVLTAAAFAQSPPMTHEPVAQAQSAACAHADTKATVGQGGDVKVPTPVGKPLGEKLARSNGVICPPDAVDPAIKAPTPQRISLCLTGFAAASYIARGFCAPISEWRGSSAG
jgi:hypothetical protein